ncbi:MAG TPA: ATP-binding protein [Pyrinomonadaceae bacterium]|nr:ATP-binding protein [Pyrinomonadaceae bacterium]
MAKAIAEQFDPRKYMQMAVDEMKKSIAENRTDGKISPKVGAVLVFPDGTVETAHRGELRDGNHAEFTLIERKCVGKKLDDAILFSTLEPCVERTPPKRGCCKHVIGARIKTVYVGEIDFDPTVAGEGNKYMEDRGVKVEMFDRDFQKIIAAENAEFKKQAKQRAKKKEKEEELNPLKQSISDADFSQFSTEALQKFLDESGLDYTINETEFQSFLTQIGAMEFDEKEKIFRPTGLGILLFGKNPRARFPNASLKAFVQYGNNKIEPQSFDQALVLIPDLVEDWIRKALPTSKDTSSFKRKDVPDFPVEVLREAVLNAIVHRDYEIAGAKSSLEIDNEKIIVKSPGAPLPSISLEQLKSFTAPSISRNPVITYVFNLMNYVEETGFGMKQIRALPETYKLPLPEYEFEEPFLTLTFPRNFEAVKKVTHLPGLAELNEEELEGYEFIKLRGTITRKQYQDAFEIESDKKAERHLRKMTELNLIRRIGSGRSVYYEIIPT